MREILFKAKRIDNCKWVEGYYQKRYDEMERERHYIFWCKSNIVWEYAEIDENTICQFTGLLDKEGNKIWENDIIEEVNMGFVGCVKFDLDAYKIRWNRESYIRQDLLFWIRDKEVEVIGNVFDNPLLLT